MASIRFIAAPEHGASAPSSPFVRFKRVIEAVKNLIEAGKSQIEPGKLLIEPGKNLIEPVQRAAAPQMTSPLWDQLAAAF
jgi:hypothetical protein